MKRNLYFALAAAALMILSLVLFFPLSMDEERYSVAVIKAASYLFYLSQGLGLLLCLFVLLKSLAALRQQKQSLTYLTLAICQLILGIFAYELLWLVKRIP